MGIPLHVNKGENEIQVFNLACEFCSLHGYNSWRANTYGLYLLRGAGGREEDVLFGLLEVPVFPSDLEITLRLLDHYNGSGPELFALLGKRSEEYRDFIIRMLSKDCREITDPNETYNSGYGGSHIWIAERRSGRRIFMMQFN